MRCNFQNRWFRGTSWGNGLFYTWSLSSWNTNKRLGFAVSVRAECIFWSTKRVFYIPWTHPLEALAENIHRLVLLEIERAVHRAMCLMLSATDSSFLPERIPWKGSGCNSKLPLVMAPLIKRWMGYRYLPALDEWLYCISWKLISLLLRTQSGGIWDHWINDQVAFNRWMMAKEYEWIIF